MLYRISQLINALDPAEPVAPFALPSTLAALYESMPRAARAHQSAVARDLLSQGFLDPDLIAAALLHDCGKGPLNVAQRAIQVLLLGMPSGVRAAAASRVGWLRRIEEHAGEGARLAAAAGASERTVWLIANHHRRVADFQLRALQAADNRH
jgi:hypothetical protein